MEERPPEEQIDAPFSPAADDRSTAIEVRHLAALAAIASEGSFCAAADRLGYVQSAISAQLTQLEQAVGVRLVECSRGQGVSALTDAGRRLLDRAERVLSCLEAARKELEALTTGQAGSVRVGLLSSTAVSLWPGLVAGLACQHPEIEVLGSEAATSTALLERLRAGELDLAICEQPSDGATFGFVRLIEDPLVALVPLSSPLLAEQPIPMDRLACEVLIGPECRQAEARIAERVRAAGAEPTFAARLDLHPVIIEAVLAGVGIALVPRLSVASVGPGIAIVELANAPTRVLTLAWLRARGRSPAARELCSVAIESLVDGVIVAR